MSTSLGGISRTLRGDASIRMGENTNPTIDSSVTSAGAKLSRCGGATPQVFTRLRLLNATMGLVHTALLAVAVVVGNVNLGAPVYATDILFVDANLTSGLAFELVPQYSRIGTLPLTWLTAAFFLCSAVGHIGNATLWRGFYEGQLKRCCVPTRWLEYQLSAPLMFFLIAYAGAVREYTLIAALVGLIAATIPFGWITEIVSRPLDDAPAEWGAPRSIRLAIHFAGYIPQTVAWGCLMAGFYDETDGDDAPAFVHAIVWSQLALFWSFGFVQFAQQMSTPACYYRGEYAYQALSLGAKATLGGLLLANVIVLDNVDEALDR